MNHKRAHTVFISILILLLIILLSACRPAQPRTQTPPREQPANPQPRPNSGKTITPLPQKVPVNDPAQNSANDLSFHINFTLDESVACQGDVKCDFAYVPKFIVYFRGDMSTSGSGALSGDGKMIIIDVQGCKTLLADNSCQVKGVTEGSFEISGSQDGDTLNLTLRLKQMPTLTVIHSIASPSGTIEMDLTPTYQEEMTKMFENAGMFNKEFQVSASGTQSQLKLFEGTYTFGGTRTLHGLGGMFYIPASTTVPEAYRP